MYLCSPVYFLSSNKEFFKLNSHELTAGVSRKCEVEFVNKYAKFEKKFEKVILFTHLDMNVSKIVYPSPYLISFYYYFSYFTLAITWIITPLLLYVIFTQSKGLKGFKWFILNHSFWCLLFETIFCLFKPIILTPAVSGFPLSVIRENGSFLKTSVAVIIIAGCTANFVIGLTATIGTRYLLIFPSKITQVVNLKIVTAVASGITGCAYIAIVITAVTALSADVRDIKLQAKDYDVFFQDFREKSLIFIPYESAQTYVICAFGIIIFLTLLALLVMFIFIHLVRKSMSATATKMQKSLIISSIFQILLTWIFLLLPAFVVIIFILFQISNSAQFSCYCTCLLSSYSVIDFMATMYFVAPYRRYITKQLPKFFSTKPQQPEIQMITQAPPPAVRRVQVHVIVSVMAD